MSTLQPIKPVKPPKWRLLLFYSFDKVLWFWSYQEMIIQRFADPRYFQILTLSLLLSIQVFWTDFAPKTNVVVVTLLSVFFIQYICSYLVKIKFDFKSPLITGLSLTILLKSSLLLAYPLAAAIAIGSKFLIRVNDKHIFNPANFGIVVALFIFSEDVWISAGQWGSTAWLGLLLMCLALLVLFKIPRRDMAFLFLGSWAGLLFLRALWLGDPLAIPLHQLQSGAILIFSFFMISDPKTIPDRLIGRFVFALAVAVLAYILTFQFRIRESLFYSLALISLSRPFIDYIWKGEPYRWITERRPS